MSSNKMSAAQAARQQENKRRWFEVVPPEGVPVRFEIATLGARFTAQLADIGLTVGATLVLTFGLMLLAPALDEVVGVLVALLMLLIRAPYYIISELFWNGQTLGKRATKLRVIAADGRGLTTHGIVIRNLMKEVEVFMPGSLLIASSGLGWFWSAVLLLWIAIVLGVPLFNRQRSRIGDMLGNTIVVRVPRPVLLPDLADQSPTEAFIFSAEHLEHYGRFELETLETLLRRHPENETTPPDASIVAVASQIIKKIGYTEPVPDDQALAFLHAFYRAQRAFLENKQVYGDVRDDKHHNQKSDTTDV